jgi:hypothetical protein
VIRKGGRGKPKLVKQAGPSGAAGLTRRGIARRDLGAFELSAAGSGASGTPAGGQTGDIPSPGGSTQPAVGSRHPDLQPPLITNLKKHGRRFSFTLSEASRVTLAIQRAKKHRFAGFAALKKSAAQGAVSIKLSRSRALRPGLYRATLVAVDAAGNRSKPLRIR